MAIIPHIVQSEGHKTLPGDKGTVVLQPAIGKAWVFKEMRYFAAVRKGAGIVGAINTLKVYIHHPDSGRSSEIYSLSAGPNVNVQETGTITDKFLVASNAFPIAIEWELSPEDTIHEATWMFTFIGIEVDAEVQ